MENLEDHAPEEEAYTLKEMSEGLDIPYSSLWRWANMGQLKSSRKGSTILVKLSDALITLNRKTKKRPMTLEERKSWNDLLFEASEESDRILSERG